MPTTPDGPARPPPVPGSFADLTAAWLTAALRYGPGPEPSAGHDPSDIAVGTASDVEIGDVRVEPLGASVGLLGDLARLHVEYTEPGRGPSTVIVKLPAADPGGHRVGAMLNAWSREVAFYQEIAPASPGARVPRCFHAAAEPEHDRWVVVLEDCPALAVDPAMGASSTQAAAAVEALAVFHRTWWNADRRFAWMPGFDTTGFEGLQGAWLDSMPIFRERYGHVTPGPTADWLERFAPTLGAWATKVGTEPLTVVHADYRLDNLIFAPVDVAGSSGDGPVAGVTMIDWQTALRGPGAMDLASFCATSLTIPDRRASESDLIAVYLDGLAAGGLEVDRHWFVESYDENLLWWMGQFANNLARLEPDDAATQRSLDTMIERTFTAALDRDVGRLLG